MSDRTLTMSDHTLTGIGSAAPAEGRAAATTPGGPTPAGQTPGRAEVHVHDAPPRPARRPVAAGGSASRRPGRRQPSRPFAGSHPRAVQPRRPAPPASAVAAQCGAAPVDLTAILNGNLTTAAALNGNLNSILTAVINGKLTAAAALTGNVTADLTCGGAGDRVRARPAGQTLSVGRRKPDAYDGSGLVWRAWRHAGLDWVRMSAAGQWQWLHQRGHDVPATQVGPGDPLFYADNPHDPASIHHVAMAIGHGRMVDAPERGLPVRVRPLRLRDLHAAAQLP
jgi:hypothetical protein